MTHGRKRIIIAVAAVLTLAGGGIALAYWTSSGTGSGTAATGVSAAFTIAADPPAGEIAPGNAGSAVSFHVTNPSDNAQYLTTVTATLADANGVAWVPPAGCLIGDYTVTMTTPAPAGDIAGGATVDGTATVTLANTGANQDACQGQDVPLYFVAS
ncbi:hypothetical protein [Amycolatopsis sp. Hca4]|uniref:hypothetical protein n=1 Tax=Amycolatopsis sp. Hca4 TaxID=2742131 RepID=UPI001590C3E0|nr:hypothetical protein [Amycolatopsis sp. Hca4]QKV73892.1 hypothetical protein HUT10_08990 [Amycolatopsis sp. Hca4]